MTTVINWWWWWWWCWWFWPWTESSFKKETTNEIHFPTSLGVTWQPYLWFVLPYIAESKYMYSSRRVLKPGYMAYICVG